MNSYGLFLSYKLETSGSAAAHYRHPPYIRHCYVGVGCNSVYTV